MRIAIDAVELEGKPTGVGRYLGNMLNSWSQIDLDLEIYLVHKEDIPANYLRHPGIRSVKIRDALFQRGVLRQQFALPGELARIKPDVFFAPAYNMPLLWNGSTVLTVHDISFESYPQWFSPLHGARMRFLTRSSVKKAAKVICDSDFIHQELIATYSLPEAKVETVNLGFDKELLDLPYSSEEEILDKYGLKRPFALMVGTLFERRYPMEVIRAFLEPELQPFQLVIAGADRRLQGGGLKEELEELGLAQRVIWLDYTASEELMGLYRSAACLIYLSEYEGFGLPPLEGMAFGLPVLISGKGTLKEIYGEAAQMVEREEEKEIAARLRPLLDNQETRQELVSRGKDLVRELTYQKCAEKTLEIIKKVGSE